MHRNVCTASDERVMLTIEKVPKLHVAFPQVYISFHNIKYANAFLSVNVVRILNVKRRIPSTTFLDTPAKISITFFLLKTLI
jgi:hypothetical protein